MPMTKSKIIKAAKGLDVDDRIGVVEALLETVRSDEQNEIDHAWEGEIERRISEIKQGRVALVPIDEAFAKLRSKCTK
jgi:putative addiction module component (TIGR02574 family)